MALFAVMDGHSVVNIIVTDNKEQGEQDLNVTLIEYTDDNPAGIGWIYDETTNTFTAPTTDPS